MRNRKNIIFTLSFVFLTAILLVPQMFMEKTEIFTVNDENFNLNASYPSVGPINISSSSDWSLYPFITGTGSEIDPYIIEEVAIQGIGVKTIQDGWDTIIDQNYYGILIDADDNFTIRNCEIFDFSIGIKLGSSSKNGTISNVEIDSCGTGIQGGGIGESLKTIIVQGCQISNCESISIFDTYYSLGEQKQYGGYGIWLDLGQPSIIENCMIEDCTYGIFFGGTINITQNNLKGCIIMCKKSFIYSILPNIHDDNTVNGKPIGIFIGEIDPLTSAQANTYGYLYFLGCANISLSGITTPICSLSGTNISLSNVEIRDKVGIGLYIMHFGNLTLPYGPELSLDEITIENQDIGYCFEKRYFKADNLKARNCEVGFMFREISDSNFTKLVSSESSFDFVAIDGIYNATIEIEKDSSFHFYDTRNATNGFNIKSSSGSYNISKLPYPELYSFEFVEKDLYHIKNRVLIGGPLEYEYIDFYVQVTKRAIPGYRLSFFLTVSLISVVILLKCIKTKGKK